MKSAVGGAQTALIAGALIGFAIALWQALGLPSLGPGTRSEQIAARVNDAVISRAELARAVEAIARDKRNALGEADRQRALQTLINEELLVQQAEAIGLSHADRSVRKAIVDAMLQYVLTGLDAEPPTEAELRALYEARPELGRGADRMRLRAAVVAGEGRAETERLKAGEAFERVFPSPLPVPGGWVRTDALDTWLPPRLVEVLASLSPGQIAAPVTVGGHAYVVWLIDREAGGRAPFEDMREALRVTWERERREAAVADYVERLRASAEVRIVPGS